MSVIQFNQTLNPEALKSNDIKQPHYSTTTTISKPDAPLQRISKNINITGEEQDQYIFNVATPISTDRIYPHIFDPETQAGQVIPLIQYALNDATLAIETYGQPDMHATISHLTNVAAAMKSANQLINFNKSLNGVVSYIRRATLTADINNVSRSSLNTLVNTLQSILTNPMLDLDDASDLVEKLSSDGWAGELEVVEALIAALLADTEDDEIQTELFTEITAHNN